MLLSLTCNPQSARHGQGRPCSRLSLSRASHGGLSLKAQAKRLLEEMLEGGEEVGTRDMPVPWHGESEQVEESGDPEAFPISITTFLLDLQGGIWKATGERRQMQLTMLNCKCLLVC